MTLEEGRTYWGKVSAAISTAAKKWNASRTPEAQRASGLKAAATLSAKTPEFRAAASQARIITLFANTTPEQRSQLGRLAGTAAWAQKTSEQKEAHRVRASTIHTKRTPEQKEAHRVRAASLLSPGLGVHHRWHVARNQINPDCRFCLLTEASRKAV
jgi:hypothetical protein